jgi:hypothetical protein
MSALGNIELDTVARIVELQPTVWRTTGAKMNIIDGGELPAGGEVPEDVLFVELTTTRHDHVQDAQARYFDVQLLRRFARDSSGKARRKARAESAALYDALHLSGHFVGADSGGLYYDIRAIDTPVFLDDRHYSLNVTLWRLD